MSSCPRMHASVSADRPNELGARTLRDGKAAQTASTIARWPFKAAQCRAVLPDALGSTVAPAAMRAFTTSTWPLADAMCNAVLPPPSDQSMRAPPARRVNTSSSSPYRAQSTMSSLNSSGVAGGPPSPRTPSAVAAASSVADMATHTGAGPRAVGDRTSGALPMETNAPTVHVYLVECRHTG